VSAALTNPAPKSDEGWKDSRLIRIGDHKPARPPEINKYEGEFPGGVYTSVVGKTLNIYTKKGNWCFWDDGVDQVLGVAESVPDDNPIIQLYTGKAGSLTLLIDPNGDPRFSRSM
jgi:hypothetical protein